MFETVRLNREGEPKMVLLPVKRRDREPEVTGIVRLHRDMDDLFHGFFRDWDLPMWGTSRWPAVDVCENNDAYVIKAEVPGCKADDIDISIQGNTLIIRGEKKAEQSEDTKGYYHSERTFGSFCRELNLACEVKADKIEASYANGILTITAPKSQKAKPVRIKIKEGPGHGPSKK